MTLFLILAVLLGLIVPHFQRRRARMTFSSHRRRRYIRQARITTYWGSGVSVGGFLVVVVQNPFVVPVSLP